MSTERDRDIDAAKGIACLCMAMGHLGFQLDIPVQRSATWYPAVLIAEISVALFFMASGMNVIHYVRHNEHKRGWGPTKNYIVTCLLLFVCGMAYNLNRQSLGLMDLFQGIAVCGLVTYLPFRRGWPSWAIAVIAAELFLITAGNSIISNEAVPHGYITISAEQFARSIRPGYPHGDLMGKYLAMLGELTALPLWQRFLFVHFATLPWAAYGLVGGLIMRHARTSKEWILWAAFAGALAASLLVPLFMERNLADYYCRGKADYVLRYLGTGGLIFLALRRYFRGETAVARWVEFVGKESFFFFIAHWFFIEILTMFFKRPVAHIPVTAALFALVTWACRFLAKRRDAGMSRRPWVYRWLTIMIVFSLAAAWFHYGMSMRHYLNIHIAHLLSFPAALGFAMAFPALRTLMRKPAAAS